MGEANRIVVGRVGGVFGTRGWIKIFSYTRPRENIFDFTTWELGSGESWKTFQLLDSRRQGKGLIAALSETRDRDGAAALVDCHISIARAQLPEIDDGEFYWSDLVGLEVINHDNKSLGRVVRLLETGANDVLVVEGEFQHLIPYVRNHYVLEVDLAGGRLCVDWHDDPA